MIFQQKNKWLYLTLLSPILWGQSILHLPPVGAIAGSPLTLEVIVEGNVNSARLYHRTASSSGYQEQNMIFDISTWKAVIPGNFITDKGLMSLGLTNPTIEELKKMGSVEVFDDDEADP